MWFLNVPFSGHFKPSLGLSFPCLPQGKKSKFLLCWLFHCWSLYHVFNSQLVVILQIRAFREFYMVLRHAEKFIFEAVLCFKMKIKERPMFKQGRKFILTKKPPKELIKHILELEFKYEDEEWLSFFFLKFDRAYLLFSIYLSQSDHFIVFLSRCLHLVLCFSSNTRRDYTQ